MLVHIKDVFRGKGFSIDDEVQLARGSRKPSRRFYEASIRSKMETRTGIIFTDPHTAIEKEGNYAKDSIWNNDILMFVLMTLLYIVNGLK